MKILFTGGGTGGHIVPLTALVREIKKIHPGEDLKLYYFGPKDDFGTLLLAQEGVKVRVILSGKIRRYFTPKSFLLNTIDILIKIPIGLIQAFFSVFFLAPDLIFSKGGYGSFTTVLAGWIFQVPIFLHESDQAPGFTNKVLSKFSVEIFASFPKTEYFRLNKLIITGNPVRRELTEGTPKEAQRIFKLTNEKPLILIIGGSQGAQRISDIILQILNEILVHFEILHQCGQKNFKNMEEERNAVLSQEMNKYYHMVPFLNEEELADAYSVADIIVSRAGSGIIFEIANVAKPSILIPLPESAQNHQAKNAYTYAETGACVVMEEENLTPHFFLEKLKYLIARPKELQKMSMAARDFARPHAGKIVAEYILDYLKG